VARERSYVVYGATPWIGPRNAEQNLAHALGGSHRVLYVDPPISVLTPFRYGLRSSTPRHLRSVLDRRVRSEEGIAVFSPLRLPPLGGGAGGRPSSTGLVRSQIARAVRRAGCERPVVVAFRGLAEWRAAAGESLATMVLMDHLPAGAELLGRDAAELEAETTANCAAAQLLCVTSHAMQELLAQRGREAELVRFGFPSDLAASFDTAAQPDEYASLPRPLLGYTGGIDDRLDFELIVRLADRFASGSIVFVGALSPRLSDGARRALASRANIHLLGTRPRTRLPAYIRHLDVALMPYADSPWIRYAAPMKLWEYLYAGPPLVGTGCPELRHYPPPLVEYAEDAEQALRMVTRALAAPAAGRRERREYALANTWQDRAAQLDALVSRRLGGDAGGTGGCAATAATAATTATAAKAATAANPYPTEARASIAPTQAGTTAASATQPLSASSALSGSFH
jgi:teichuronic acid biosynthesis glycosyltransferase TuaH